MIMPMLAERITDLKHLVAIAIDGAPSMIRREGISEMIIPPILDLCGN